jgi:two-component system, NtrC family, sensor histidine kinase KinB
MSTTPARTTGLLSMRLFLNLLPLVIMLLALGLYAIVLFFWLARTVNVTAMKHYQSVSAAQAMSLALARMQGGVLMVFDQKRDLGRSFFTQNQKLFEQSLAVLQTNTSRLEEKEWNAQLAADYRNFAEAGPQILAAPQVEEQRRLYTERFYPALGRITALLEKINRLHHDAILAAEANTRAVTQRAVRLMLIGLAAALVIASYACYRVSCSILEPIQALTRAARALGEGRFDRPVAVAPIRELGELAVVFNRMTDQLRAYRQSTTEELVRLHAIMESTLASFPDPIFVLDAGGRVELTNPAADHLAKALQLNSELPSRLQPMARQVAASGESFLPHNFQEVVSFPLDGEDKFFLPRIVAMRHAAGASRGIAVVLYDVTRFRLLDDAKTNLVGTVSHELKTPLTGLGMALQLLLENTTGELNPKQTDLLQTARRDSERLQRILNDLLDLTRLDAGNAELTQEEVSPEELVAEVTKEMSEVMAASGLRLVLATDPALPTVRADRERLRHVFANLISNAIKHSPPQGEVVLRVGHGRNNDVAFSVLDEGPGVPEQYRSRVFDRFFRVPGQKKSGTGLGLSIAREIVVAHGGQIGVKSREGRGSEFYFTLPGAGKGPPH